MRKKILIVEDNSELLELLRITFKEEGFAVATARNGMEAIRKAKSVTPDAVVLDLILPELDGFAVCELLRKDQAMASVPVLMLTGLSSQFTKYTGFESGATDYLMKPTQPKELVARVRALLAN